MNQQERIQVSGSWWAPRARDQQARGILEFTPEEGATLQLGGGLLPLTGPETGDVIEGQPIFGTDERGSRAVTLLDGWETSSTAILGGPNQIPQQTIRGHTVLTGARHPDPDPKFAVCVFSLEGLAEWCEPHFRLIRAHPVDPHAIEVDETSAIEFETSGGRLKLWAGVSRRRTGTRLELEMKASWTFISKEALSFDELWTRIVQPLKFLQILVTSEPTSVADVQLGLPTEETERRRAYLEVHADWLRAKDSRKDRFWEWPVHLNDVADRLGDVVNSWLKAMEESRASITVLFSVLAREKDFYLEARFLTIAQAAEAYHRHQPRFPKQSMPETKHQDRLSSSINAVPQEHRQWLEEKLRHSNEPTFRHRLKDIRGYVRLFGSELIDSTAIDRIVAFRNELTHVLSPIVHNENERTSQIHFAGEKLALLLRAALLKDAGLTDDEIREALLKSQQNRFVAEYRFPD